ncbi:hypothetical protein IJX73_01160 [bacterium]|nr:hypothetical protein [bacterium]MBQ9149518.1 hypothetical protein [bacterium]
MSIADLFQKKVQAQITSSSSSAVATPPATSTKTTTSSTATSGSATKTGISAAEQLGLGADFYNDSYNMGAQEAIWAATNASNSLFDRNSSEKMVQNGKIINGSQTINGLNCIANGGRYKVTMDTDGDGTMEEVSAAEAMAASFDSELDLYIESELNKIIQKYGHRGWTGSEKVGFLSEEAKAELLEKGIKVDMINNRTYTFSLVDENGNVMVDENGNEGSILFGDWVIPDGYAQGAEQNLSSMLDMMGYDCVSKADFINGNEDNYDKVLNIVQTNIENGAYSYSDKKVSDIYGEAKSFASGHGSGNGGTYVPGSGLASIFGSSSEIESIIETPNYDKNTKVEELASEDTTKIKEAYKKFIDAKMSNATTDEDRQLAEQEAIKKVAQTYNLSESVVEKVVK